MYEGGHVAESHLAFSSQHVSLSTLAPSQVAPAHSMELGLLFFMYLDGHVAVSHVALAQAERASELLFPLQQP